MTPNPYLFAAMCTCGVLWAIAVVSLVLYVAASKFGKFIKLDEKPIKLDDEEGGGQ